jgi:protein TonB
MRDPLSRFSASSMSSQDSWLGRVRDNFHQLLSPVKIFPSSANGAPIHLLKFARTETTSRAGVASLFTHCVLLLGLVLLGMNPHRPTSAPSGVGEFPSIPFTFYAPHHENATGHSSLGKSSGGGENDARPTRHGLLAPGSSQPLMPPRRPENSHPILVVPAAVFDANAPQFPAPVNNLGLPWMKDDSDSAGPGKDHGFGTGNKGGMGDKEGPGAGQGVSYDGPYANVVSRASCAYCPDPQYTDEAREAKLQGSVTLHVLVGADGRASQIRLVRGIGLGLDERAMQSVRGWKFIPARDAAHRPVPQWVTIEAIFRLF